MPLHLTLAAKEETLASLVSDKWLSRTDNGQIALGVMAFLELRNFFKNFDLPLCDVCNEAAIKVHCFEFCELLSPKFSSFVIDHNLSGLIVKNSKL